MQEDLNRLTEILRNFREKMSFFRKRKETILDEYKHKLEEKKIEEIKRNIEI